MRMDFVHPADQLVTIMTRIYGGGLTTLSGGNLSIREPNGDLWVTPGGVDKGSLSAADIVCVHPDGSTDGHRRPASELPFHQAVYAARDNIQAVLHAHSPAIMAFSIMNRLPSLHLTSIAAVTCGKIGLAAYATQGTGELGQNIAAQFREGCTAVILENHGVCVAADSISHAYMIFETLEFAARSELTAARLGPLHTLSEEDIDLARSIRNTRLGEFTSRSRSSEELAMRRDICHMIQRGARQQLFTSAHGTLSARLDDGSFLITPYGLDRLLVEPEDLVLVRRSMKEKGKIPSRAVFLHELIYYYQPGIRAIINAQPTFLTALSMSDILPDCRLMPESYLLLRQIPVIPYGLNYEDPRKVACIFTPGQPAVLLQNDGVIVTGGSILEAFDRFEVAEFTARVQLSVPAPADLRPLSDERIAALDRSFGRE